MSHHALTARVVTEKGQVVNTSDNTASVTGMELSQSPLNGSRGCFPLA